MINRDHHLQSIAATFRGNPICALLGPRQCGKTTLAREYARRDTAKEVHYFDLESATARVRLANPELTLSPLSGLVIIDEIQRLPELFVALCPLADRPRRRTRFLILGSASPELVRGVSESLAGRVGFVDLGGFDLREVEVSKWQRLWQRGGFPRSFLAASEALSVAWRANFIRTFLERDVPLLGIRIAPEALRRFWTMLAHFHGQLWNGAELARSLGVTEHTVRGYLDVLTGTYLLRQLQPWHENLSKRQFKSPKVYVRDSGLLHALLGQGTRAQLEAHPKVGASWEGFALEQVLNMQGQQHAYFWGTHSGAELDLLLLRNGKKYGVEFKFSDAPTMTKSLHIALADLNLELAWIVYPGSITYKIHPKVQVVPITMLQALSKSMKTR